MKKGAVSLRDVADKANVGAMRVSRVINNAGSIKEATRDKVLRIVKESGYQKNVFASIDSRKRSKFHGFKHVVASFANNASTQETHVDFYSAIFLILITELNKKGVQCSIIRYADLKNESGEIGLIVLNIFKFTELAISRIVFDVSELGRTAANVVRALMDNDEGESLKSPVPVKLAEGASVIDCREMTRQRTQDMKIQ